MDKHLRDWFVYGKKRKAETEKVEWPGYLPWRVGRTLGKTLYQQRNPDPSKGDEYLGIMETPELAVLVCNVMNEHLRSIAEKRNPKPGSYNITCTRDDLSEYCP